MIENSVTQDKWAFLGLWLSLYKKQRSDELALWRSS